MAVKLYKHFFRFYQDKVDANRAESIIIINWEKTYIDLERPVPESEPGIPVPKWVPELGNKISWNREIWYQKMHKIALILPDF